MRKSLIQNFINIWKDPGYSEIGISAKPLSSLYFPTLGNFLRTGFLWSYCTAPKWARCVCVLSRVQIFATPWTVARQTTLSWDLSDKNTRVDCHFLLQGICPTQRLNPPLLGSPALQAESLTLSHQGSGQVKEDHLFQ